MMRYVPALLALIILVAALTLGNHQAYPEVEQLSQVSWTLEQYQDYFTNLAKKKDPVYAFKVLREADIAFGVDTHTLGHAIGYVLYDQKGVAGLADCSDRYRGAACAHAIVLQEYIHQGSEALERLANACAVHAAGSIARADCLHGLGHGILVHLAYDYEDALPFCREAGEIATRNDDEPDLIPAWYECVDGMTMEMFQGNHDRVAWERAKPTLLPDSDLFMPCNASYMDEEMRPACYAYIRARVLNAFGRTRANPELTPEQYTEALAYCERIPETASRKSCYGGFGVDFVYVVNGSDDRKFKDMTDKMLSQIHTLCGYAGTQDAVSPCTLTAGYIISSRGEGLRAAADFCELTPDPVIKDRCHNAVAEGAEDDLPGEGLRKLCRYLPADQQHRCRPTFGTP